MPDDIIGRVGVPFVMQIERGKVAEFRRSVGDTTALGLDDDEPVSPPTFLATSELWAPHAASPLRDLGLDLNRALHAEQEFIFYGPPPRAGTQLHAQSRVADTYQKEGKRGGTMTFFSVVTEFRSSDGRLVAEGKWTEVETARPAVADGM